MKKENTSVKSGLFNENIKKEAGTEVYYTIMMEQWKTANEMAANISEQRNSMNNFYISLISVLVGGILFSDQLLSSNIIAKTVLCITIGVIGFICCQKWISQIENYKQLNGAKYEIINELEKNLSANVISYEYLITEKNEKTEKRKTSFSDQEKSIAKLFRAVILIVPLIIIISSWAMWLWERM